MSSKIKATQVGLSTVLDSLGAIGPGAEQLTAYPIQVPVLITTISNRPNYSGVPAAGSTAVARYTALTDTTPFVLEDPNDFVFNGIHESDGVSWTYHYPTEGQLITDGVTGEMSQFDYFNSNWHTYTYSNTPLFVVDYKSNDGSEASEGQLVARGDTPTNVEWGDYLIYQKTYVGWVGRDTQTSCIIYRLDNLTFEYFDTGLGIFVPVPSLAHTHDAVVSGGAAGFLTGTDKTKLSNLPTTITATLTTTNNTPTDSTATITLTGSTGDSHFAVAHVSGVKSDGTLAMVTEYGAGFRCAAGNWAVIVDSGGGAVQMPYLIQTGFTGSVSVNLSGADVTVRVTGMTGTTINWTIRFWVY